MGGQVPGVAARPPALSFPVLLLLHHVWEKDGEDLTLPIFLGTHCVYDLLRGCSDWQKPSKTAGPSFTLTSFGANQKAGSHWHKERIWGGCRKEGERKEGHNSGWVPLRVERGKRALISGSSGPRQEGSDGT